MFSVPSSLKSNDEVHKNWFLKLSMLSFLS